MAEREKVKRNFYKTSNKVNKKSLSRLIAVQALYQYNFHNHSIELPILTDELLDNYILNSEEKSSSYRDKIDSDLLAQLVNGIILTLPKIDEEISQFLQDKWKIENLSDMILPILRLGVFELKFIKDTPLKVIINEYVDIAGCFYGSSKVTFVNGILEKIAIKLRPEEFNKIKK